MGLEGVRRKPSRRRKWGLGVEQTHFMNAEVNASSCFSETAET
jgi:hypothetical protein